MATFRKRSDAWQARIQRNGYPDQSKTFSTRSEALAWARNTESEMDKGITQQIITNNKALLRDLLERYKREVTVHKKHPAAEGYRIDFWLRHRLASLPISAIKSADIARWREERLKLGRAPNTLRLELAVLSNLFTVAANEWSFEGLCNPTTKVKLPKLPSGRVKRLEDSEIQLILSCSDSTLLKPIVMLAIETGMRRGEIASIEWRHIDFIKSTIFLPMTKNGDSRDVPMSKGAQKIILELVKDGRDRVFNITPHGISIAFGRACKRANILDLHFHDLRHEAVSRLFEKGFSLPEVAAISGHKTWAMLKRYTHLKAEDLAKKLG